MNIYKRPNIYRGSLILILFPLYAFLTGCKNDTGNEEFSIKEYFDIPGHFIAEAERLQQSGASLRKTLTRPDDSEEVHKDEVDWQAELKPFIDIDLNKPAFSGGYTTDTIMNGGDMAISYTAIDSTFDIKKATLVFHDGELTKMQAEHSKNNVYYYSREILIYEAETGYEITVSNIMKAGKPVEFTIKGEIIQ
jgi:hypothetical protein